MFTEAVIDRFQNPENAGSLHSATHFGQSGSPGDGPYTQMWLQINGSTIHRATFESNGCPAAVACACLATQLVENRSVQLARNIKPIDLTTILGGLPEGKEDCAARAVVALQAALENKL